MAVIFNIPCKQKDIERKKNADTVKICQIQNVYVQHLLNLDILDI